VISPQSRSLLFNMIFGLMVGQDEGIQAKMAEVKMYTDMLEKLKRGKGV
jgi:hypothetical protein